MTKLKGLITSVFTFCFLIGLTNIVLAKDPEEIQSYLRKITTIQSETLGKEIPLNVYNLENNEASLLEAPVIVYIKGLAAKGIGSESDLSILSDYIKQGYIVITVDYAGDKRAISPAIDKDLYVILNTIYASKRNEKSPLLGDIGLKPTFARCFFLPAGYRVATDLVFWEVDKYGSYGTMERVVRAYNEQVADPKGRHYIKGRSPISSSDELVDREGKSLDFKLRMDIIYPSLPDKKVPLIFWNSTGTVRSPSSRPGGYRPHMTGFPMRGYAYAIIDHCYNPVALHYGHFERGYSLDDINGLKAYTAAIRFLRAHADIYNIDSRYIGGWGHSKGSYGITRLSDPNHATQEEYQRIKGKPEGSPEPQPWFGYSSNITAGYQSMGNGTRRSTQYVTNDYVPTIVACGKRDHYNHWLDWPRVVNAYENADANHVSLGMLELGHELPYGYDDELGVDRYELVMNFFDSYLKVEEKPAPVVLYTKPHNHETNVVKSETISIQFAPVMNEESIVDGKGVKIVYDDGSLVEGNWRKSRQGTHFEFTPAKDFKAGGKYKMIIASLVENENGTPLGESRLVEFTVKAKKKEMPKGWVAQNSIVEALEKRDQKRNINTNFREENVPDYTLPKILEMVNGKKVKDSILWRTKRRPEIFELFQRYAYGRAPIDRPEGMTFKITDLDRNAMEGQATRKQVEINFEGKEESNKMNLVIFLPNNAVKPAPTYLLISHRDKSNIDPLRKVKSGFWPAEEIIERGYGIAAFYAGDLDEDNFDNFKDGVHAQFDKPGKRRVDAWGTLAAWAWGASRAMDYFEIDKEIDHEHVAVVGHSRGGKTALWVGATDERFAMVVSNSSGCGGAALSRRKFGNPVDILNIRNPHWYCENYKQYNNKEELMPFDQHMLLALIAPRLLYVASAGDDLWADPRGEFLSCIYTKPVYELLGVKGLQTENMPSLDSPLHSGRIGYHIRTGKHDLTEYDWQRYMDFTDKHWKEK